MVDLVPEGYLSVIEAYRKFGEVRQNNSVYQWRMYNLNGVVEYNELLTALASGELQALVRIPPSDVNMSVPTEGWLKEHHFNVERMFWAKTIENDASGHWSGLYGRTPFIEQSQFDNWLKRLMKTPFPFDHNSETWGLNVAAIWIASKGSGLWKNEELLAAFNELLESLKTSSSTLAPVGTNRNLREKKIPDDLWLYTEISDGSLAEILGEKKAHILDFSNSSLTPYNDENAAWFDVRVNREALLNLHPPQISKSNIQFPTNATAKGEADCRKYLVKQMQNSLQKRTKTKKYFELYCTEHFQVSKRGFERAWSDSIRETGARWSKPGRPRKIPSKNPRGI